VVPRSIDHFLCACSRVRSSLVSASLPLCLSVVCVWACARMVPATVLNPIVAWPVQFLWRRVLLTRTTGAVPNPDANVSAAAKLRAAVMATGNSDEILLDDEDDDSD